MKIMWLSNAAWASTGYGNQTRLFVKRIQEMLGYEMATTAFYGLEGAILQWDGIPVYPKGHHTWGMDVSAAHTKHFGADVTISLMDAWVTEPEMVQMHGVRWVPWFPVDHEPLPPPVARKVKPAFRRIVFSQKAVELVNEAGMDCAYVPHGVDCDMFKPGMREEARERFKWADKFVIGMVAANKGTPSRKALPEHIEAFARFHAKHDDAILYIHTHPATHGEHQGVNVPEICEYHGLELGKHVFVPDTYQMILGYSDEYMRAIYNAMDVFLLASMGEGFGIPIIEAQACGTPVIVGDWTATGELCLSGWKIARKDATPWYTPLASYQFKPRIGAIVDALEQAYKQASGKRALARKKAKLYDADRVTKKYWKPVLAEIEEAVMAWQ